MLRIRKARVAVDSFHGNGHPTLRFKEVKVAY